MRPKLEAEPWCLCCDRNDTERPPASLSILQLPSWAETKAAELAGRLAAALGDDGGARRIIDHLVLTRGLLGAAAEVEAIEKQCRAMGWA